jgi:hypothetical protein
MAKKPKKKKLKVNVDEMASSFHTVTAAEVAEFKKIGSSEPEELPITAEALTIAAEIEQKGEVAMYVADSKMLLQTRRILIHDLDRIAAGSGKVAMCRQKENLLTFVYVRR